MRHCDVTTPQFDVKIVNNFELQFLRVVEVFGAPHKIKTIFRFKKIKTLLDFELRWHETIALIYFGSQTIKVNTTILFNGRN